MIVEHALLQVGADGAGNFEPTFVEAVKEIASAPGCLGVSLARGVESPGTLLLLVRWESLEAHTEAFRGSEAFSRWRAAVGPHFTEDPAVEHFEPVYGWSQDTA